MVTLKKIEAQHLPAVDEAFAKSLGIAGGTVEALRADVRKNLEREVKFRVLARNKASVMDALVKAAELEVPKSLVAGEVERMIEHDARRPEEARRQGRRDGADPGRDVPGAGRAARAPRAWWWASWCAARTCRPSPSSCRRTSRSWRRATRSRPR